MNTNMKWVTWDQAAITALLSFAVTIILHRLPPTKWRARIISLGIVFSSTSRWRWLYLAHLLITVLAVSATGNHWWLDGVAAIALLGAALLIDRLVRNLTNKRPTLNFVNGGQSSN
jgi:hypothetical protein